jgi:hypothetical protein
MPIAAYRALHGGAPTAPAPASAAPAGSSPGSRRGTIPGKPAQITVLGDTARPVPFRSSPINFSWALILATSKGGTANTGNVRIGVSPTPGELPITLAPGDQYEMPLPPGMTNDFQNWFLEVDTAGDGIVVIYV